VTPTVRTPILELSTPIRKWICDLKPFRPALPATDAKADQAKPDVTTAPAKGNGMGFRPVTTASPPIPVETLDDDEMPSFLKDGSPPAAPPTTHPFGFRPKRP